MACSAEFLSYVKEQLSMLRGVSARRMFGGYGLYCEDRFFGLISGDVLYFKVDDGNRPDYEARGMGHFRPFAGKRQVRMNYFEVPADVLEDAEQCAEWARRSVAAAHR